MIPADSAEDRPHSRPVRVHIACAGWKRWIFSGYSDIGINALPLSVDRMKWCNLHRDAQILVSA